MVNEILNVRDPVIALADHVAETYNRPGYRLAKYFRENPTSDHVWKNAYPALANDIGNETHHRLSGGLNDAVTTHLSRAWNDLKVKSLVQIDPAPGAAANNDRLLYLANDHVARGLKQQFIEQYRPAVYEKLLQDNHIAPHDYDAFQRDYFPKEPVAPVVMSAKSNGMSAGKLALLVGGVGGAAGLTGGLIGYEMGQAHDKGSHDMDAAYAFRSHDHGHVA